MYYVRYSLSYRQVEDILYECGIDICYETVRYWVARFGLIFASEIRQKRKGFHSNGQWHLDEVFVKINDEQFYLWRAVDHEGEVLESIVTKRRNKIAALKFISKTIKKQGVPRKIITDKLRSYSAALKIIGASTLHDTRQYLNNRCEMVWTPPLLNWHQSAIVEIPKTDNITEIHQYSFPNFQSRKSSTASSKTK